MFSLSSQSRIFIHALPTDMRKSFDALCGIVKGDFQKDIMQGDYFVFFNRVLDRCKILMWERDELLLVYKRLERGRFQRVPCEGQGLAIEVDLTTLTLMIVDMMTPQQFEEALAKLTQQVATLRTDNTCTMVTYHWITITLNA